MKTLTTGIIGVTAMLLFTSMLTAQVPVAVLPIQGGDGESKKLEQDIRRAVSEAGCLSVIGDNELKQVMDLHEKAQALGSEALDVSKLKVAEYMVKASIDAGKASITAIAVNSNTELFNKSIQFPGTGTYGVAHELKALRDSIILDAYSVERKLPQGTEPYMKALRDLVQSLVMGEQASYPYLAFYAAGAFKHPEAGNKTLERSAKVMLGEIRPRLTRSRLIFGGIAPQSSLVTIYVFADKLGKKTKHKFDFMDLPDGTLGITQYQPVQ